MAPTPSQFFFGTGWQRVPRCYDRHMRNPTSEMLIGAAAGLVATIPMTIVMRGLHLLLPARERYPLPPQQITTRVSRAVGIPSHVDHRHEWELKTHAAHYSYGAGCGVAYALAEPHLPGTPAVKGALFGIGVWTASYLGWLPAAGIHRSATREPAGRNGVMLLAHVVYGATAATLIAAYHHQSPHRDDASRAVRSRISYAQPRTRP